MNSNKSLTPNHFIISLEYGVQNIIEGISYNELISFLKGQGFANIDNLSFRRWFYGNFFCENHHHQIENNALELLVKNPPDKVFDDKKSILTGSAYFKYLEYIEVKGAFKSSRDSTRIAIAAIVITVIVGVIQIALSLSKN